MYQEQAGTFVDIISVLHRVIFESPSAHSNDLPLEDEKKKVAPHPQAWFASKPVRPLRGETGSRRTFSFQTSQTEHGSCFSTPAKEHNSVENISTFGDTEQCYLKYGVEAPR